MKELRDQKIRHAEEQRGLEYGQLLSSPDAGEFPMLRKRREELNKIANLEMKLRQDRERLALEKKVAFEDGKSPTAAQRAEIEKITHEINMQEEAIRRANVGLTDGAKIANDLAGTIESSMTAAFQGLINGTMTVKQAFASMAQSILQQLARVIAEMITMRILASMFGGFMGSGGNSAVNSAGMTVHSGASNAGALAAVRGSGGPNYSLTGLPGNRYGGVMGANGKKMPGYAVGGIARGPQAGYPVELHGTEAIVPLPNGKSIPVEMQGAGGTQVNQVTVNVAADGQTTTEGRSGMDMEKLGTAVAGAVQKELQNQKRSGGILNPYGVA
jgi:lambda family phage tail tape measure protein